MFFVSDLIDRFMISTTTNNNESYPKFYCGQCGRSYKFRQNLQRHLRYECGKEASFYCPYNQCGFKSKQRSPLLKHLRQKHNIIDPSRFYGLQQNYV